MISEHANFDWVKKQCFSWWYNLKLFDIWWLSVIWYWSYPGSPVCSMKLAVVTSSLQISYWKIHINIHFLHNMIKIHLSDFTEYYIIYVCVYTYNNLAILMGSPYLNLLNLSALQYWVLSKPKNLWTNRVNHKEKWLR